MVRRIFRLYLEIGTYKGVAAHLRGFDRDAQMDEAIT